MKQRFDERYETDTTPSREVVERYRDQIFDEESETNLALVHYRGGEEEFRLGQEYCASGDAGDRATGAAILAQLGWSDQTYLKESVEILIPLVNDADHHVAYCTAVALGHRSDESAIPTLLTRANDPDSLVRFGVVLGLSGHEDPRAIAALIALAGDDDHDVRNWAVFGLGSQIDVDSPEIREALKQALSDPDQEIRGEALVGLAERGDNSIISELLNEWKDDHVSIWSLEAAEITGDPRLFHRLNQFTTLLKIEDDSYFSNKLESAINACNPLKVKSSDTLPS